MSTILDALRKVEEEKRTQVPDVRTRLLSTSPRFDFRMPRRSRLPWIVGGGLVFTGIALGTGLMLWPLPDTATVKGDAALSSPPTQPTPVPPQADSRSKEEKLGQPPQTARITPNAAVGLSPSQPKPTVPPPATQSQTVASTGGPNIAQPAPGSDPGAGGLMPGAAPNVSGQQRTETPQPAAAVQRSPFVNSSPPDRIAAPPVPSPSASPQVAAAPRRAVRRSIASEKNGPSPSPAGAGNDPVEKEARSHSAPPPASTGEETPSALSGASLSFLQWSADPEKRVASIKIGTSPATIAHEGDAIEGMTVVKIRPDAVELRSGNSHYVLKAR